MFRRSSAVEQLTVNQLVVGSIPTAGAKTLLVWPYFLENMTVVITVGTNHRYKRGTNGWSKVTQP